MNLQMFWMLLAIFFAGGVGGLVNALMTDNGFLLPKTETGVSGISIIRPGSIGNIVVGSVAALVSWGLYGPLTASVIIGQSPLGVDSNAPIGLTIASLVGAILVGVGGARWLSNEVDKNLLRATAAVAASKPPSIAIAQRILTASPAQALNAAAGITGPIGATVGGATGNTGSTGATGG